MRILEQARMILESSIISIREPFSIHQDNKMCWKAKEARYTTKATLKTSKSAAKKANPGRLSENTNDGFLSKVQRMTHVFVILRRHRIYILIKDSEV